MAGAACAVASFASVTACVTFTPEVKQTFEPQSAKEHSNFDPRSPPYGPIYVGPLPVDASADVVDVDVVSAPIAFDGGPLQGSPPASSEAGVL